MTINLFAVLGVVSLGGAPQANASSLEPSTPFFADCSAAYSVLDDSSAQLEDVFEKLRNREAFQASFEQRAFLSSLDFTESATGKVYLGSERRMRWEYAEPEEQVFLLADSTYWLVQPVDRQIVTGKVGELFSRKLPVLLLDLFSSKATTEDVQILGACRLDNEVRFSLSGGEGDSENERIVLVADKLSGFPRGMTHFDAEGNWTSVRFLEPEGSLPSKSMDLFDPPGDSGYDVIKQ